MYPPPRASKITGGFPCGKAYVRPSPSLSLRRFFMDAPRRPSPSGRTRAPRSERKPGSWAAPSWAGSSAGGGGGASAAARGGGREGGTWKSIVPIILPADAPAGKYRVIASVESAGGGKDVEETNFKVQR